jgi:hypothetical protein
MGHVKHDHERNEFKISPSGYGIHWSLLDEDLSINGLLKAICAQCLALYLNDKI